MILKGSSESVSVIETRTVTFNDNPCYYISSSGLILSVTDPRPRRKRRRSKT